MILSRLFMTMAVAILLTSFATGLLAKPQTVVVSQQGNIERSYVSGPFGQMHIRRIQPDAKAILQPPLILFHPTPFSGAFFEPFMVRMGSDRLVIAIDTPGYGSSDRPDEPQSIEAYTSAMVVALEQMGLSNTKYDVLGYHTGGLIAAEVALQTGNVRRLVLPGVPFYVGKEREEAHALYAKASPLEKDGSHLTKKWDFAALALDQGLSLEQAQVNFSDMIQAVPYDWWAYHGVFTYQSDIKLPKVDEPALLIAVAGSLSAETKAAAALMPQSTFLMMPDVKHGLFAIHLDTIESATRGFLDSNSAN